MTEIRERFWFTTAQGAEYTGYHVNTVLLALEAGELVGYQRKAKGSWRIHRDDLDAWVRGGHSNAATGPRPIPHRPQAGAAAS